MNKLKGKWIEQQEGNHLERCHMGTAEGLGQDKPKFLLGINE
jgi:hypothetical protein